MRKLKPPKKRGGEIYLWNNVTAENYLPSPTKPVKPLENKGRFVEKKLIKFRSKTRFNINNLDSKRTRKLTFTKSRMLMRQVHRPEVDAKETKSSPKLVYILHGPWAQPINTRNTQNQRDSPGWVVYWRRSELEAGPKGSPWGRKSHSAGKLLQWRQS